MFSTNKLIKKTINKQTNKNKKTREEIGKVESNDSPEIPDRRWTSDIPGLPSGTTTVAVSYTHLRAHETA